MIAFILPEEKMNFPVQMAGNCAIIILILAVILSGMGSGEWTGMKWQCATKWYAIRLSNSWARCSDNIQYYGKSFRATIAAKEMVEILEVT
jgi:hypothetical protein